MQIFFDIVARAGNTGIKADDIRSSIDSLDAKRQAALAKDPDLLKEAGRNNVSRNRTGGSLGAGVHPDGLEPPTYSSVDCRSIQLSYGCLPLRRLTIWHNLFLARPKTVVNRHEVCALVSVNKSILAKRAQY